MAKKARTLRLKGAGAGIRWGASLYRRHESFGPDYYARYRLPVPPVEPGEHYLAVYVEDVAEADRPAALNITLDEARRLVAELAGKIASAEAAIAKEASV